MKNFFLVFCLSVFLFFVFPAQAQNESGFGENVLVEGPIDFSKSVVLFYSETCARCHEEKVFLEKIQPYFPDLVFIEIEVETTDNETNINFFNKVMDAMGSNNKGTPRLVADGRVFAGFSLDSGELQWLDNFKAYMGYQNRIMDAVTNMSDYSDGLNSANLVPEEKLWKNSFITGIILFVFTVLFVISLYIINRKNIFKKTTVLMITGIGMMIIIGGLFLAVSLLPEGKIS